MASIRIDGWQSGVRFDAAHMIPGHPKCGRLHGHTYAIHVEVHGRPAANGFILDFGDVKAAVKQIADELDHHVLVATKSAAARVVADATRVRIDALGKAYEIPAADALLLPVEGTTAEALAEYVADELASRVRWPATVERIDVGLDESYGKGAWTSRAVRA